MSKLLCSAAIAGAFLFPQAAGAVAVSSASLDSGQVTITTNDGVSVSTGELFSTASAALGATGTTTSDNDPIPGVADAPMAVDGTMNADSLLTVQPGDVSFSSEASGSVAGADFGTALGEVTGSFDFTNDTAGLVITLIMDLTRTFNLSTDLAGELASGATAISLAILDEAGLTILPTILLSDPTCDPNAAFSVSDGASFSGSCTTNATFGFAPLAVGNYTLTFASNSSVDVVGAEVPIPAAFGLFGLGAAALGAARRLRRQKAAA